MAATILAENWKDESGDRKRRTVVYVVGGTTNIEEARAVVPQCGNFDPTSGMRVAQDPYATRLSPDLWEVRVTYQHPSLAVGGGVPPVVDNGEITVQWIQRRQSYEIDRDVNGNPITNSAGEPFSNPPQAEKTEYGIVIKKWETGYTPQTANAYIDHVNATTWNLFAGTPNALFVTPGVALCTRFGPEQEFAPADAKLLISYEFLFAFDGWKTRNLDSGYRRKLTGGQITSLVDSSTVITYAKTCMLDGKGDLFQNRSASKGNGIPAGATLEYAPPMDPLNLANVTGVFLRYERYKTAEFNNLGF